MACAVRSATLFGDQDLPPAFFLTDPDRTPNPLVVIERLPTGVGVIYRHFGRDNRTELASELRKVCARRGLVLLIAADPELAMHVGADGVHWPEAMVMQARRWDTRFPMMSQSAHSPRAVRNSFCPIVLYSTVFKSNSATAQSPMGAMHLRRAAKTARSTVFALGGVTSETVGRLGPGSHFAAIDGFSPFSAT